MMISQTVQQSSCWQTHAHTHKRAMLETTHLDTLSLRGW